MSDNLFKDFDEVSSKQWKQKIQVDLKGADYNDTLIWKTNENINVKPFYHADEFDKVHSVSSTKATQWNICQSIFVSDIQKSNKKTINVLGRGADSIKFIIPNKEASIELLLSDIDLTSKLFYFELQFLSAEFIKNLNDFAKKNSANFIVNIDIIGNLLRSGNWFFNIKEDHNQLDQILRNSSHLKHILSVDVSLYQNAGANIVQQLAYALAHANEYLNHYKSLQLDQSISISFNVAVGTNYFFEISKLRALRRLWKVLSREYDLNTKCHIFSMPSKRNKALYDYNTNMLRTTTECMSSIIGGANTICNLSYDGIYHKDNEFGERIARNQLLVLKHESYFDKVNNPSDGAYYIESLTQQLSEKALDLFKDIESQGGFLKLIKDGVIQRKIKESALKEQTLFDQGTTVILGTNKHPNAKDKMKSELELYPFVKTNPRKTLIEPIIEKRLAETLEQERLKTE